MRLARRFRGVALLAAAFLLFGAPSAPGVFVDWVPSIGVAWATPCDVTGGPEDSTRLGADTNDPCRKREPWWERIWDHLMNAVGCARAITIGNTVHYAEGQSPDDDCELRVHEGHHVRQYQRLGPLFIPIYITVAVFTRYWDHPMEEAAREAESQCPTSP